MMQHLITLAFLLITFAKGHGDTSSSLHNKSLAKYGTYGRDFFYYRPDGVDSHEVIDGVTVSRFYGRHNKTVDIVVAQPFITKLEIPAGHQFPLKGSFWLRDDNSYVVIKGNATFDSEKQAHGYGDVYWVNAGWPHGPIHNAGNDTLTVLAIGMDWNPQYGPQPSWFNPSVDWYTYQNRSYLQASGEEQWMANPSNHSTECLQNGGVWNMGFAAKGNTMPVLRVKWAPHCAIPFHYHPTGAMYFVLYGTMYYSGDFLDGDRAFNAGDARWVRPGFAYGPEYNGAEPMEITVFGTVTPAPNRTAAHC